MPGNSRSELRQSVDRLNRTIRETNALLRRGRGPGGGGGPGGPGGPGGGGGRPQDIGKKQGLLSKGFALATGGLIAQSVGLAGQGFIRGANLASDGAGAAGFASAATRFVGQNQFIGGPAAQQLSRELGANQRAFQSTREFLAPFVRSGAVSGSDIGQLVEQISGAQREIESRLVPLDQAIQNQEATAESEIGRRALGRAVGEDNISEITEVLKRIEGYARDWLPGTGGGFRPLERNR